MGSEAFNPYRSFTITAAAGSGKTYQLAGRYLRLVAAGARIDEILCCTFTNKAAAEMRQRILENAFALLADPKACQEFDREMKAWAAASTVAAGQPLPAVYAARQIIAGSDTIQVQTIDSFFAALTRRFAPELGLEADAEIADQLAVADLREQAWKKLTRRIFQETELRQRYEERIRATGGTSVYHLRQHLEKVYQLRAELEAYGYPAAAALRRLRLPEPDLELARKDFYRRFSRLLGRLQKSTAFVPYRDKLGWSLTTAMAALRNDCPLAEIITPLQQAGVLKKFNLDIGNCPEKLEFSQKSMRRQAVKTLLAALNAELETVLRPYRQAALIPHYNRTIDLLATLYHHYEELADNLKKQFKLEEFTDRARAALQFWRRDDLDGPRYHLLLGIRHLLLDEFQDTSRLQWEVFHRLLDEALLSGESIFSDFSLFLVGDEKQSIYAFRNADYRVLEDAVKAVTSHPRAENLPLNESFRASDLLLKFINHVFPRLNKRFADAIPFSRHRRHQLAPPLPGGSVNLYPVFAAKGENNRLREAEFVAAKISQLLADPRPLVQETGNGKPRQRRVRPGDITILYRYSRGANLLLGKLQEKKIPVRRDDEGGFLQQEIIRDCLAIISLLADPADELALLRLLRSPLSRLDADRYFLLLRERLGGGREPLLTRFLAASRDDPLARALNSTVVGNQELPFAQRFTLFLEISRARQRYRQPGGDEADANLDRFLDLLTTGGCQNAIEAKLQLEKLLQEDIIAPLSGENGDYVRMLTVHRAKGLENKVIFLYDLEVREKPDSGMTINRSESRHRLPLLFLPSGRELPPVDFLEEMQAISSRENFREEVRILYVALTRASQHLFITSSTADKGVGSEIIDFLAAAIDNLSGSGTRDLHGDPCRAAVFRPFPPEEGQAGDLAVPPPPAAARLTLEAATLRQAYRPRQRRRPSQAEEFPAPAVPGRQDQETARRLGIIVHRFLEEELRGLDPDLEAICQGQAPPGKAAAWVRQAGALLAAIRGQEDYQQLLAAAARPETGLAAIDAAGRYWLGRLDAVAATAATVTAADYKTGGIDRRQLEIYRQVLEQIFPHGRLTVLAADTKAGTEHDQQW